MGYVPPTGEATRVPEAAEPVAATGKKSEATPMGGMMVGAYAQSLAPHRHFLKKHGWTLEEAEWSDAGPTSWSLTSPDGQREVLAPDLMLKRCGDISQSLGYREYPSWFPADAIAYIKQGRYPRNSRAAQRFSAPEGDVVIYTRQSSNMTEIGAYKYYPAERAHYEAALPDYSRRQIDLVFGAYTGYNRDLENLVECRLFSPTEADAFLKQVHDNCIVLMAFGIAGLAGGTGGATGSVTSAIKSGARQLGSMARVPVNDLLPKPLVPGGTRPAEECH